MRRFFLALAALLLATAPLAAQADAHPMTLTEAIAIGRLRAVDATLSRLGAEIAGQKTRERRAALLPTIAGSATVTRQTLNLDEFGIPVATGVTDPFTIYRFQATVHQALFDAAAFARLKAARDSAVAAGLDAQAVGDLSGAAAGVAWLRVLSARETVKARQADSTVAASLLDQSRQLVDAGVSPAIDATRSDVSFAAIRSRLEIARNQYDRARLDLIRMLGVPSDSAFAIADSVTLGMPDVPADQAGAVTYAREHRAELAAEHARTVVAQRRLKAYRYENLPTLVGGGAIGESGQHTGTLASTWSLQLGLSIPIFDGFRRQARSGEQSILLEAQQAREADLRNRIDTEAREAVLDLASARQQVQVAEERLTLAEQELDQAGERFTAGVAGTVETTNAQASVIDARDGLIQARVNGWTALVNLYRALGALDDIP